MARILAYAGGLAMLAATFAAAPADARDIKVVRKVPAPAVAAPDPASLSIVRDVTPLKPTIQPAAAEAASGCARKVKVIYPGYGEADRASCSLTTADMRGSTATR